jgi:hypothetical protein
MLNNYITVTATTSLVKHKYFKENIFRIKLDIQKSHTLKFYDSLFYKHKKQFIVCINFKTRRYVLNLYPSGQKSLRFYFNNRYTIKDYTSFYN